MLTDELVSDVRTLTQLPDTDEDWTDEAILFEASQALNERFEHPIVTLRSGHWLQTKDYTMTAGMPWYRIHPRAAQHGLELFSVSNTGSTSVRQLSILTQAEALDVQYQPGVGDVPRWFTLDGDGVTLYPTPQQAYPLTQKFYLRPPTLVMPPEGQVGILTLVANLNPTSTTLKVDKGGTDSCPWSVGDKIDVVNLDGSGGAIVIDATVASTSDGTTTWNVTVSPQLTSLEYAKLRIDGTVAVMTAEEWWSIPLPREMHSALAAFTAATILVDKGDAEKAAQLVSRCEASVKAAVDVMTPRVKTRPFVFRTRNSFLRRRVGFGSFR